MSKIDFSEYKKCLKQLLNNLGYKVDKNLINCLSSSHNDKNPSMKISDESFNCFSCGVHGDVYDMIELLRGITDKAEQYREVQSILGDSWKNQPIKQKKEFQVSLVAEKELTKYFKENVIKNKDNIKSYLKQRKCTDEMIDKTWCYFSYWPGHFEASKIIDKKTLFDAGIPGINPKTNKSSWSNPGVVLKIGQGFKLFFYDEKGKSKKIGTKKCKTFPQKMPDSHKIFLVEGEIERCSMKYIGYTETIAVGGVNAISDENIKSLLQYDEIYIIFDGDQSGRTKREKLKERLREKEYTGEIYIVRLPTGKDPDDLIKSKKDLILTNAILKAKTKTQGAKNQNEELDNESQEKINKKKPPFCFLGFDENNNYWIMQKNKSIPIKTAAGDKQIKNIMNDIAPPDFWRDNFENTEKALIWFRQKQLEAGMYDPGKINGIGAYYDDEKKIVVNCGDGIFHKNKKMKYENFGGKGHYKQGTTRFKINGDAWNKSEGLKLYDEIGNYGFSNMVDYMLLTGWITLAPFASLLHRRPHLGIMGSRGCGKTTLIDNIIRPALGETGIFIEGKTTEPGIRQKIGRDCRPTVLDEFEAHNQEEETRNKNILALARSAYGGEGEIIKGTTNGTAMTFKTRMMFCFCGVNINFDNDADRSRIALLNMNKSQKKIGKSFDFSGLRRRTLENFERVQRNIELAKKYINENLELDARGADTFGTLLGGFWSTISDCLFLQDSTKEINEVIIKAISELNNEKEDFSTDEQLIFDEILSTKIKIGHVEEKTIAELLTKNEEKIDSTKPEADDILKRIGIRKDENMQIEGNMYNAMAISINNKYLKDMLKNSPHRIYKNILLRHEGKLFSRAMSIRMSSNKKERCIVFDWDEIKKIYFEDD